MRGASGARLQKARHLSPAPVVCTRFSRQQVVWSESWAAHVNRSSPVLGFLLRFLGSRNHVKLAKFRGTFVAAQKHASCNVNKLSISIVYRSKPSLYISPNALRIFLLSTSKLHRDSHILATLFRRQQSKNTRFGSFWPPAMSTGTKVVAS
jgi:hypothetical protein